VLADFHTIGSAGVPFGLSLAFAVAGERFGSTRRRAALNEALHELRRPLQALSLAASGPGEDGRAPRAAVVTRQTIDAALTALAELDRAVNGRRRPRSPRPVSPGELVRSLAERWRGVAVAGGRSLTVRNVAGDAKVVADRPRVERAIENLIVNALEHGTGAVRVTVALGPGAVRIVVADEGPAGSGVRASRGRRSGRDPRRGHGLHVAAEVARQHGGRFLLDRSRGPTEAVLELPRAAPGRAAHGIPAA
jgi:signal transduction histidine kinase